MEQAKKQNNATYKEFRAKIMDLLTPEQKEQLKKRQEHKKQAEKVEKVEASNYLRPPGRPARRVPPSGRGGLRPIPSDG